MSTAQDNPPEPWQWFIASPPAPYFLLRHPILLLSIIGVVALLLLFGAYAAISLDQTITQATIAAYQQSELEIVRATARSIEYYAQDQLAARGRTDVEAIEQEIYERFVAPLLLRESGTPWIYAPDRIIAGLSQDLPEAYQGKSMAAIFDAQAEHGASHYEDMVEAVVNAREGTGWYIWLPEKGQEIAAWTPVRVGDQVWTIGLSTPLSTILEATGAAQRAQIARILLGIALLIAFGLLAVGLVHTAQRNRTEVRLRSANQTLETLIQGSPLAIITLDLGGRVTSWNTAAERLFGWRAEEALGRPNPLFEGRCKDEFLARYERLRQGEIFTGLALCAVRRDGSPVDVSLSTALLHDARGQISGIIAIFEDIGERQQAEAALRESEGRYRTLFRLARDAILVENEQQEIVDANRAASRLFGYPREVLLGMKTSSLLVAPDASLAGDAGADRKLDTPVERIARRHDGTLRTVGLTVAPVEIGGQTLFLSIVRDMTERARIEEELRHSEALAHEQRVLAEALRDTIAVLTGTLDLDTVMRRILENVGRVVPHEGVNILLIDGDEAYVAYLLNMPPESEAFARSVRFKLSETTSLQEMLRTRSPLWIPDTAGYPGWISPTVRSYVGAPLRVHDQIIGFLNLDACTPGFFDASDAQSLQAFADQAAIALENAHMYAEISRHAAELEQRVAERTAELTAANAKLRELDQLKSKFIADISHELRTPLTNLSLRLYLLENDRAEKRAEHLDSLKRQYARLRDLLEYILDFSRLEETLKHQATLVPVDLNTIVAQVVSNCRAHMAVSGATLNNEPAADLPLVLGNPNYLGRVVTNLLLNAINYTPKGEILIRTAAHAEQKRISLEVRDTGIGISPEDLPHIFERFYRGQRVGSSNIPGAGLGLSTVKEIVDLHGGSVEVESEVDRGSVFRVWLPST